MMTEKEIVQYILEIVDSQDELPRSDIEGLTIALAKEIINQQSFFLKKILAESMI